MDHYHEQTYTCFTSMQAGRFDSVDDVKSAKLSQSLVGSKKDELMVTSNGQSVPDVCKVFEKFMRFSVELQPPEPTAMVVPNAFTMLNDAYKSVTMAFHSPSKSRMAEISCTMICFAS